MASSDIPLLYEELPVDAHEPDRSRPQVASVDPRSPYTLERLRADPDMPVSVNELHEGMQLKRVELVLKRLAHRFLDPQRLDLTGRHAGRRTTAARRAGLASPARPAQPRAAPATPPSAADIAAGLAIIKRYRTIPRGGGPFAMPAAADISDAAHSGAPAPDGAEQPMQ